MRLRVHKGDWEPFIQSLCHREDVETAGVILAEQLFGGDVLLGREFIIFPENGYQIRKIDQLRLDPVAINRVTRPARDRGLSVITVHTHPGANRPWFSAADDSGDARLMPSLLSQMPGPHGSIVVAGKSKIPIGRVWQREGEETQLAVNIVGLSLEMGEIGLVRNDPPYFERQQLALGKTGQATLRHLHVGVVGLGGTGSISAAQLAHLGIGELTLIDGDRVEASNVSRILGATALDAGRTAKVAVAQRYIQHIGLGTHVNAIESHLTPDTIRAIERCDVVLSCVDRHAPRALLNRLSYNRAVPLIDMGSAFRVDEVGRIIAGVGRVVVVGPDRPCLACWGHVDPVRLRIEALAPEERASEAAQGYIDGADVPQPSVISFNTMIAGAAVIELLRLVTRFAGSDTPPLRLSFDFEAATVRRNQLAPGRNCGICGVPSEASVDDKALLLGVG